MITAFMILSSCANPSADPVAAEPSPRVISECRAPIPPKGASDLSGYCVLGTVIRESRCIGKPHKATYGYCAQVVTDGWELGGRQITLVTRDHQFEDGVRVELLLGEPTSAPNRQQRWDEVWRESWPEPYWVGASSGD